MDSIVDNRVKGKSLPHSGLRSKFSKAHPMGTIYKLPLVLDPQPEGGYTVTCPLLPELVTEGDTVQEALNNVTDALAAILEAYEDLGRPVPPVLQRVATDSSLWLETAVAVP